MRRRFIAAVCAIAFLIAPNAARAGTDRDACEGDNVLDIQLVEADLDRTEDGRQWTFTIETCEAFTPDDLESVDGGEHYAMSIHIDTARLRRGDFERTVEIYNCTVSTDQVCAEMWGGVSKDTYYGGPRSIGEPDATQSSSTTVTVIFPNRWLGKKARDKSGFGWRVRTADDSDPGYITFDYSSHNRLVMEYP